MLNMKIKCKIVRNQPFLILIFLESWRNWAYIMSKKAVPFLDCASIRFFMADRSKSTASICASLLQLCYSQWIPKGKNGRLQVRFGQGCLERQRKLIIMSPQIFLHLFLGLKILLHWYTILHDQSGSFCSHILKSVKMEEGTA